MRRVSWPGCCASGSAVGRGPQASSPSRPPAPGRRALLAVRAGPVRGRRLLSGLGAAAPLPLSLSHLAVSPPASPLSLLRTLEKMNHEAKKRKPFSAFPVFFLHFTVSFKLLLHLTSLQVRCDYFAEDAALLSPHVSVPDFRGLAAGSRVPSPRPRRLGARSPPAARTLPLRPSSLVTCML